MHESWIQSIKHVNRRNRLCERAHYRSVSEKKYFGRFCLMSFFSTAPTKEGEDQDGFEDGGTIYDVKSTNHPSSEVTLTNHPCYNT